MNRVTPTDNTAPATPVAATPATTPAPSTTATPAATIPGSVAAPAIVTKKTRKPRSDAGQPRKPTTGKKPGRKPGKKAVAAGKQPEIVLFYQLLTDDGKPTNKGSMQLSTKMDIPAKKFKDAIGEVLSNAQDEANRESHLGKKCRIIAVLDSFTIAGDVAVTVRAER